MEPMETEAEESDENSAAMRGSASNHIKATSNRTPGLKYSHKADLHPSANKVDSITHLGNGGSSGLSGNETIRTERNHQRNKKQRETFPLSTSNDDHGPSASSIIELDAAKTAILPSHALPHPWVAESQADKSVAFYRMRQVTDSIRLNHSQTSFADVTKHITKISEFALTTGGFGDVHYAHMDGVGKVALKRMRTVLSTMTECEKRFRHEAETWFRLDHPNVLRFLGLCIEGPFIYMCSPWQESGDLLYYLGSHPESNRVRLTGQIASALCYLHGNGIIHGDLKGNNVLISSEGDALLCDFGLSIVLSEISIMSGLRSALNTAGTYRYMAPELIQSHDNAQVSKTTATDMFAFGLLIYEIFTGKIVFQDRRDIVVALETLNGSRPKKPADWDSLHSDMLWCLAELCWESEPNERPSSLDVDEFLKWLPTWQKGKRDPGPSPFLSDRIASRLSADTKLEDIPRKLPTTDSEVAKVPKLSTTDPDRLNVIMEQLASRLSNLPTTGPEVAKVPKLSTTDPEGENVLILDWDGPDDPQNPKNWSYKKKWTSTIIVSLSVLNSSISSSMIAPASEAVAQELRITNNVIIPMITTVFILPWVIGPLVLGPLSNVIGRRRVLQGAILFYFAWNLACGFAKNTTELIVFRFLSGLGSSGPSVIGGHILGDIWTAHELRKAIAIYSLVPLLGPTLAPVCGAWIAARSTWRWVFWSTSIVTITVQIAAFLFLPESYAPLILEKKAARFRKSRDLENQREVSTIFDSQDRHWRSVLSQALARPFAIFAREPIVLVISLYLAFISGIFYLFLTTIPSIFSKVYHESTGIAGLNYIALGIGILGASQANARFMDRIYVSFKNRNDGVGVPEFRVPSMVLGSIFLPVGLLFSGWFAEVHLTHVYWVATDVGIAIVGGSTILCFQSMQTYLIDSFTPYGASALTAVRCLQCLASFGFPLFAPVMYNSLGYGKGNTVLAGVAIVIGCPVPFVLWKYGAAIRAKSRYTSGGDLQRR